MEYAVRGPIVLKAANIEEELKKVRTFKNVYYTVSVLTASREICGVYVQAGVVMVIHMKLYANSSNC